MDSKKIVVIVLSFLAFLLALIATFAPGWIVADGIFNGFFQVCGGGTCFGYTGLLNHSSGTQASAAFMIIGTFVLLLGFVLVLLGAKNSDSSKLKSGGIITIAGGGAVFLGVAVFAGIAVGSSFSFSFGFAWLSASLGIAGGILAVKTALE